MLGSIGALRSAPRSMSGFSSRVLGTNQRAEKDLEALSLSPNVFAAVQRRALTYATYPIRVYKGYSIGGKRIQPLDPSTYPWVGSLLRLLQTPDPRDQEGLFPANPGETVLSQMVADLILTGNAFCAVQSAKNGDIIGLYRLHPRLVQLERRGSEEFWVYRPVGQQVTLYPRRTVSHLRLLSWQANGLGELGTGAGSPLRNLVAAEVTALAQTASVVEQGGADVLVTAKTTAGANFLSNKENRENVAKEASQALMGEGGRRVFVVGGDLDIKPSGLTPADVRAPELLQAARAAELAAVGVVPVAVGSDAGTYATAVQQYRTQAELDEQIASVLEAGLLRPLARHFARQSGQPRTMLRADEFTARFDLSSHPGYGYLRTEQANRVALWVKLGWSPIQAAEAEGVEMPDPTGQPDTAGLNQTPNNGPGPALGESAGVRSLFELFPGGKRAVDPEDPKISDSDWEEPPYDYVLDLKENWPEIWGAGGNERGNEAFEYWTKYNEGDRTEGVLDWVVEREAWGARHEKDFLLAGVVAQLKWGVVGSRGFDHQKKTVEDEKRRLEEKKGA